MHDPLIHFRTCPDRQPLLGESTVVLKPGDTLIVEGTHGHGHGPLLQRLLDDVYRALPEKEQADLRDRVGRFLQLLERK